MISSKLPQVLYGGDYNPEQWPAHIWDDDVRLFQLAGINLATLNVFSWALNQPSEEVYNFEWLDHVIDKLYHNNIFVNLATSTAAHPAWLAKKYPDILQVDFEGRKRTFGGRHNSCPNSPTFRRFAPLLAEKLAERYKDHPALVMWHINNEYGGGGVCYCENCGQAFRGWLQNRYGSLENLNAAWYTGFWSHTFYDWDEIVPANQLGDQFATSRTCFQAISLDYNRFYSDSLLECYLLEYAAIKKHTPDLPITTNLMGAFKPLDYFKWAKHLDVVSWDCYPAADTPVSYTAMLHDLMRGLKDGQPFLLMEQTPSQQNWQAYNSLKRPGVLRLGSYQAVARGADSVLYFQLRRSRGACEKFHGAVIEHAGHENTRVFREVAALGSELQKLGSAFLDARVPAKVGLVFDWENWWAVEYSSGPSVALKYLDEVYKYYRAFYELNIPVDMVGVDTNLENYSIVIAPVLYMLKPGYAQRLEDFVNAGGLFLTTFFSGIVNETDLVTLGGYPGELRRLLGIWAEEIDALFPEQHNRLLMQQSLGNLHGEYKCGLLCDLLHLEGAEALAVYGDDFYQGMPALTRNNFGKGQAWYVASSLEANFLSGLAQRLCEIQGITPLLQTPVGVEVTRRVKNDKVFLFILNHNAQPESLNLGSISGIDLLTGQAVAGQYTIAGRGVLILAQEN